MMQSRFAPAPPTTSSTSWKVHSVVQSLTRTVRIFSPQPPSFSAATMFLRAPGLASGAQASSRSRNTWSAGSPLAFSRKRGLEPGTPRQDRRGRRGAVSDAGPVGAESDAVIALENATAGIGGAGRCSTGHRAEPSQTSQHVAKHSLPKLTLYV